MSFLPRCFVRAVRLAALVLSAVLILSIAGCGRKGPLYIPDDAKPPPIPTSDK